MDYRIRTLIGSALLALNAYFVGVHLVQGRWWAFAMNLSAVAVCFLCDWLVLGITQRQLERDGRNVLLERGLELIAEDEVREGECDGEALARARRVASAALGREGE